MATPKPVKLDALSSMIESEPPAPAEAPSEVYCQVCATSIDAETGEPLEPVGQEQVEAVKAAANAS